MSAAESDADPPPQKRARTSESASASSGGSDVSPAAASCPTVPVIHVFVNSSSLENIETAKEINMWASTLGTGTKKFRNHWDTRGDRKIFLYFNDFKGKKICGVALMYTEPTSNIPDKAKWMSTDAGGRYGRAARIEWISDSSEDCTWSMCSDFASPRWYKDMEVVSEEHAVIILRSLMATSVPDTPALQTANNYVDGYRSRMANVATPQPQPSTPQTSIANFAVLLPHPSKV